MVFALVFVDDNWAFYNELNWIEPYVRRVHLLTIYIQLISDMDLDSSVNELKSIVTDPLKKYLRLRIEKFHQCYWR